MKKPDPRLKTSKAGTQMPLEPREPVAYPAYPRRPGNLSRTTVKIVSSQPHLPEPGSPEVV